MFNAVVAVQNRIQDGRPLINLVVQVMAPVRFSSQAALDTIRALVNEKLLLAGFLVREDDKVVRAKAGRSSSSMPQRSSLEACRGGAPEEKPST